jgi:hypothetical protein
MAAVSVRLLVPTKGAAQNAVLMVDEAVAADLVANRQAVIVPVEQPVKRAPKSDED